MVTFKGQISESIQKDLGIKKNTRNGVRGVIFTTFLIAPSMFLWIVALSIIKGKESIIKFDVTPVLIGAIILTGLAIIMGVTSFKKLIFPYKNLPDLDKYEYESSIDENSVKSVTHFIKNEYTYKQIKTAFKGEGYFLIYGKGDRHPIVLEEKCVVDGSFSEAEELLSQKISKKKHTSKEKLEKTNTYSIVGIVCSSILVAITIPLLLLILSMFVSTVTFTIENILIPISEGLIKILFPFDDILMNVIIGIVSGPAFIVCCIFIWIPVILFECGVFFLIYPSILCCSLIFPLKQLTVNKNKFTKSAIILAVCMVIASIASGIIYITVIN